MPDDRRAFDRGQDLQRAAAAGTEQRIHLVDVADQARPRTAHLQGSPIALSGGWVRRRGVPEEPVLLPIPTRAIGVPAVEEGGLLVRLGDVGAHLGEEIQGSV